ncbi:MAG: NAD-dependent epimerase/dehydratase family protein, partial [Candidatus Moranbacteria bacterium]|nr:NAD-dependent epimerase/dehydratase family protein [Candidatus Moranbacteria bacterium]
MKKILITGGGGYIGSHVVKFFLERGFSIVVLDNFSRGYREP